MKCLIWQSITIHYINIYFKCWNVFVFDFIDLYLHLYDMSLKNLWQVGVSFTSKRYSKGNNKYLKAYDSKQESNKVIYLDTNNLYG